MLWFGLYDYCVKYCSHPPWHLHYMNFVYLWEDNLLIHGCFWALISQTGQPQFKDLVSVTTQFFHIFPKASFCIIVKMQFIKYSSERTVSICADWDCLQFSSIFNQSSIFLWSSYLCLVKYKNSPFIRLIAQQPMIASTFFVRLLKRK